MRKPWAFARRRSEDQLRVAAMEEASKKERRPQGPTSSATKMLTTQKTAATMEMRVPKT
jgi:hypothetical protein